MQQIKITQTITKRSDGLDIYLNQISKLPLITPEEEVELTARIHEGDTKALHELVNANLRFVVSVAKQYQGQGQSLMDIIENGNIGLIKAAEDFDETRGFKFISYAVWWIRQSILQGLAEQSKMVRLPLNQVGLLNKINKAVSQFQQENGRYPSESEIGEMIDFPEGKVRDSLRSSGAHLSMDAPFEDGEDGTIMDVIPNRNAASADEGLEVESLKQDISRALSILTERERQIILLSFGIGCPAISLEEIGEQYGLTRERVRQIRERSVRKLKAGPVGKLLMKHL